MEIVPEIINGAESFHEPGMFIPLQDLILFFFHIFLIPGNIAQYLFQHIMQSDHAGENTIFINDHGLMCTLFLKCTEHLIQCQCFRNQHRFIQALLYGFLKRPAPLALMLIQQDICGSYQPAEFIQ